MGRTAGRDASNKQLTNIDPKSNILALSGRMSHGLSCVKGGAKLTGANVSRKPSGCPTSIEIVNVKAVALSFILVLPRLTSHRSSQPQSHLSLLLHPSTSNTDLRAMHFFRKHCKLHAAAKTGDAHALKNILDTTPSIQAHNALLESVDHHGKTALLRACKYGHRGAVIALLRAGANLRAIDERKRNCMHHAVANGHVDVAEALLRRGAVALLEQVDAAGKRPLDLHPACNQVRTKAICVAWKKTV